MVTVPELGAGERKWMEAVDAVRAAARAARCRRLWLIATNDNAPAMRFYQRHGMRMAALHRDALEVSRRLKPEIPLTGLDGIPLPDEIEFEDVFE